MTTPCPDIEDKIDFTMEDLYKVVEWHIVNTAPLYRISEALRCAVWDCPRAMTAKQWVDVCDKFGFNEGTARNRRSEALRSLAVAEGRSHA